MQKSVFDTVFQQDNLQSKIVVGLERIAEAFKVLLWEFAKTIGLSPIQIQMLIFIKYHNSKNCNVSDIAKEFNVTKPTVSDAVKVLEKKDFIIKKYSETDKRSYSISLTKSGVNTVKETEDFANPISKLVGELQGVDLENMYSGVSQLISKLHTKGILSVQRTCFTCQYYNRDKTYYCNLLEQDLKKSEIRLDCPEHIADYTAE